MEGSNSHEAAERLEQQLGLSSPELVQLVPEERRRKQLQCVEYLRRQESKKQGRTLTESQALWLWHERSYDEKFCDSYETGYDPKQLYREITGGPNA